MCVFLCQNGSSLRYNPDDFNKMEWRAMLLMWFGPETEVFSSKVKSLLSTSFFYTREPCCLQCRRFPWRWKRATLIGHTPLEASRKLERPLKGKISLLCGSNWNIKHNSGAIETFLVTRLLHSHCFFCSLQDNRPLSKAFFTTMIQMEKKQVCISSAVLCFVLLYTVPACDNSCLYGVFLFQETPKMNNLRDYYERALQEFGTSDDGNHSCKGFYPNMQQLWPWWATRWWFSVNVLFLSRSPWD